MENESKNDSFISTSSDKFEDNQWQDFKPLEHGVKPGDQVRLLQKGVVNQMIVDKVVGATIFSDQGGSIELRQLGTWQVIRGPRITPNPPKSGEIQYVYATDPRNKDKSARLQSKHMARDIWGFWVGVDQHGRAAYWSDNQLRAWTPILDDGITPGEPVDLDALES